MKKIAFKSSLDLYFHLSIIDFKMEEKIHTEVVVDVSRGSGGTVLFKKLRRQEICSFSFEMFNIKIFKNFENV